jgi:predicted TIM-barrel fold metal-dependent hydrolase
MQIVDAHTHVVSRDLVRYPIEPAVDEEHGWHRDRPVDADELMVLAEAAGVRGVAFVQAISCHGYDNRYVIDSAQNYPGRTIAVGSVRPDDPEAASSLRRDVVEGGMRGVRLFSVGGATAPVDHPSMRATTAVVADLGVPVVLLAVADQLPSVRPLVEAFPTVTFVLDHCGFADLSGDESFARAGDLFALADLANLSCKVSSITLQTTHHPRALWSALASRFGSERLMWGSDFPHTTAPDGYAGLVDLARSTTDELAPGARADVLGATALRHWPSLA